MDVCIKYIAVGVASLCLSNRLSWVCVHVCPRPLPTGEFSKRGEPQTQSRERGGSSVVFVQMVFLTVCVLSIYADTHAPPPPPSAAGPVYWQSHGHFNVLFKNVYSSTPSQQQQGRTVLMNTSRHCTAAIACFMTWMHSLSWAALCPQPLWWQPSHSLQWGCMWWRGASGCSSHLPCPS